MASTSYHSDGTDIYNTNLMLDSMTDYYYSYAKGIKDRHLDSRWKMFSFICGI